MPVKSRAVGIIMMIGGAGIALAGVVGWATSGSGDPESAAMTTTTSPASTLTQSTPSTSAATTTTATTSTTTPSTTTTTVDAAPAIESFVDRFTDAITRVDTELLLQTLHPAVIALFDEGTCRQFISEEILQLEQYRLIGEVEGPTRQVVADMTVDMYRAPVAFAFQGQEFTSEAAFAFEDGEPRWFTQCGE